MCSVGGTLFALGGNLWGHRTCVLSVQVLECDLHFQFCVGTVSGGPCLWKCGAGWGVESILIETYIFVFLDSDPKYSLWLLNKHLIPRNSHELFQGQGLTPLQAGGLRVLVNHIIYLWVLISISS